MAQLSEVKHSTQGLGGTWLWGYWGFYVDSVLSSWGRAVSPSQSLMTVPSPAYTTLSPLRGKEALHHACALAVAVKWSVAAWTQALPHQAVDLSADRGAASCAVLTHVPGAGRGSVKSPHTTQDCA